MNNPRRCQSRNNPGNISRSRVLSSGSLLSASLLASTLNASAVTFNPVKGLALPRSFFITAAIAPNDQATIYAMDIDQMVIRSTNGGATWSVMCRNSGYLGPLWWAPTALKVSEGADKTAYTMSWGTMYRVDAMNGANCPIISPSPGMMHQLFGRANLDTDSSGNVYVSSHGGHIYKSTDRGATWTQLAAQYNAANVLVDPFDSNHILLTPLFDSTVRNSSNAGVSFQGVSAGGTWDNNNPIIVRFNPAKQNRVYSSAGYISTNGGGSWTSNSNYSPDKLYNFHVNKVGRGFRLQFDEANHKTLVQRALDMTTNPTWTTLAGGTLNVESNADALKLASVDSQGSTVVVVVKNKLFVSRDYGSNFVQKTPVAGLKGVPAIASGDGVKLMSVSRSGDMLVSADAGMTWTNKGSLNTLVFPAGDILGFANQADSNSAVWRANMPGNYPPGAMWTQDGFATASANTEVNSGPFYAYNMGVGQTTDSQSHNVIALVNGFMGRVDKSTDGGASFTNLSAAYIASSLFYMHEKVLVHPVTPNILWTGVGANYQSGLSTLYQINTTAGTITDVTSKVPFGAAGWESYKIDSARWIRVVGRSGQVAKSYNHFSSFTTVSAASSISDCGDRRIVTSLASNRERMVTACFGNSTVSVSKSGGKAWANFDMATTGCGITNLVITATRVYASCMGDGSYYFVY